MSPTISLLIAVVSYHLYLILLYLHRRSQAKATGLPYFSFPIGDTKLWYIILGLPPVIWVIENLLPPRLQDYVNTSCYLRRWNAKHRVHKELGDVVLMVSSGQLSCYIADAAATREVFAGRGKYIKPSWNLTHLKLFGNNVVACDDAEWIHHRKHTKPPFNEHNSALVWQQALVQTTDMLTEWESKPQSSPEYTSSGRIITSSRQDFRRLALHVISSAAFGISLSFSTPTAAKKDATIGNDHDVFSDGAPSKGYSRTWRDALEYISMNFITVLATLSVLPRWAAPGTVRVVQDVEKYLNTLVSYERANDNQRNRKGNLLSAIVRKDGNSEEKGDFLTDREIVGNLFIFSVAGHETTASTLQYALVMLALHPEMQEWFLRRLDEQLEGVPLDATQWDYEKVYERLSAPRCLMYEILRLFPPIPGIPKWISTEQSLTVGNSTHLLPGGTFVTINAGGLHHNPKYWGPNADAFDPSRWDLENRDSFLKSFEQPKDGWQEAPGLYRPLQGSFASFSGGQRVCLGRKFASVEFVGVMAALMRGRKVSLARMAGETEDMARDRAWGKVRKSVALSALVMTDDVGFVLEGR
ncbi:cytochrome P450 [Wilcoxina mikolae CBS 423.85]|nr:cytochrome P450 [Wilcoxina mikolae CBS 423.85]